MLGEVEKEQGIEIDKEFAVCAKEMQALSLKEKLQEITKDIQRAENQKDAESIKVLMQEFQEITKNLNSLHAKKENGGIAKASN